MEAGSQARRLGALGWKVRQMRDDRLHRTQLVEHVVAVEDLADVRANLRPQRVSALFPLRSGAVPIVATVLWKMAFVGATLARLL